MWRYASQIASNRVLDLLASVTYPRSNCHCGRPLGIRVGRRQTAEYRKPPRLYLSPTRETPRLRLTNRNNGKRGIQTSDLTPALNRPCYPRVHVQFSPM